LKTDGLEILLLRTESVPPLNCNTPDPMLVIRTLSASINPAFRIFVPRRMSSKPVAATFVTRNVPPSTTRRFLKEAGSKPTYTALTAETTALLLTISWFPAPASPTRKSMLLLHDDPKPATTARLLLALEATPMSP